MAKTTKRGAQNGSDWKRALSAGALFVGVLGTLLLGAILQADPQRPGAGAPLVLRSALERVDRQTVEASSPPVKAEPGLGPYLGDDELVDRVADDERRLYASGNGYTLQFAVLCETENVRSRLEQLRAQPDFYLLTMLYKDRACFRLCWGFYDTEAQARAERRLPAPLLSITREPKVISIAEALP